MAFLSGTTGYVKLGSTSYSFDKWRMDMKANAPKVTNFTSAGYQVLVAGVIGGTLTLSGPINSGSMALAMNSVYTFHLGLDTGVELAVSAIVTGLVPENDVNDSPRVTVTAETSGAFTSSIT